MPEAVKMVMLTDVKATSVGISGARKLHRDAFTLLELLLVMGIMILLMTLGVAGYLGMRRGAEMRGGVATLRTTLMLARQQAVTKRHSVRVEFIQAGETNAMQVVAIGRSDINVHPLAELPPSIEFKRPLPGDIVFASTGVAAANNGDPSVDIVIQEKAGSGHMSVTSTVWVLTGLITVQGEE